MADATINYNVLLTIKVRAIRPLDGGGFQIEVDMLRGASARASHVYIIRADGSVYEGGVQIAANTPAQLLASLNDAKTRLDTALQGGATAGKITV